MKTLTVYSLLLFILLGTGRADAQDKSSNKEFNFFLGFHLQKWNYTQLGLSVNFLTASGHGISYSMSTYYSAPRARPSDCPVCNTFSILWAEQDHAFVQTLRYQRVFWEPNARVRFTGELGINFIEYSFMRYEKATDKATCYDSFNEQKYGFGLSTRITIDLPVFRATGLQLSINANFNKHRHIIGPELTWTLGKVRNKLN